MNRPRGKQILKIETKLKQTIRGALIPHAGRLYAGHARYAALRYFKKNTKQIIYLATLHNINNTDKTYILHRDKGFRLGKHNFINTTKREHSFDWVHEELRDLFPSAKILALAPNRRVEGLHTWIINYLNSHKNAIFLATIDLIHYGKQFNNTKYLSYPQQMSKIKKEESLIEHALAPNSTNNEYINKLINADRNIVDGPKTLEIFLKVMAQMRLRGRVTDYYDSYNSKKVDLIDRYSISMKPIKNLVSYVSIVYGKKMPTSLLPIDILLAIGLLKSIIIKETFGKQYSLRLPSWSPLNKKIGGVFVGTSLGTRTTCSYGTYETGKKSTADNLIKAAYHCPEDAAKRWGIPYTDNNINNLSYKVEFLDPESQWKTYRGYMAPKKFHNNGSSGIFLRLANGKGATYLPSVFKSNPQWSVEDAMHKLTEKAEGRKLTIEELNAWKNGVIKIYNTTSYTWNPHRKLIDVIPIPFHTIKRRKSKTARIRKKYHHKTRKNR
jgi:predicted class III extradiol MEMO1 family dioxygenase